MLIKDFKMNNLQITCLTFYTFASYNINAYFLQTTIVKVSKFTTFRSNHIILTIKIIEIMWFGMNAIDYGALVVVIHKEEN